MKINTCSSECNRASGLPRLFVDIQHVEYRIYNHWICSIAIFKVFIKLNGSFLIDRDYLVNAQTSQVNEWMNIHCLFNWLIALRHSGCCDLVCVETHDQEGTYMLAPINLLRPNHVAWSIFESQFTNVSHRNDKVSVLALANSRWIWMSLIHLHCGNCEGSWHYMI